MLDSRLTLAPMILLVSVACEGAQLTTASVQAAVNQVVAWTQKGGSVTVLGVREIPVQNQATADLRFNNFQYNATGFTHEPRAKNETTPTGDYVPPSAERHVATYSGPGVATLTHYNDGRWVLTTIDFDFKQLTSNVTIGAAPAPTPAPAALVWPAFCDAIIKGDAKTVASLMQKNLVNRECNGTKPLSLAIVSYPNANITKLLLDAGADINFRKPNDSSSYVSYSAITCDLETTRLLLKYKPDLSYEDPNSHVHLLDAVRESARWKSKDSEQAACKEVVSLLQAAGAR